MTLTRYECRGCGSNQMRPVDSCPECDENGDADMVEMSPLARAEVLYKILEAYPSSGQLTNLDQSLVHDLLLAGFIEKRETTKSCSACGTPKVDHSWYHITNGGRLFMAVMEART